MAEVTVDDATNHLPELIARVEAGEEITIVRGREPVARLLPPPAKRRRRGPGFLKGQIYMPDSFFDPLPPEELEAWGQV